MPCPYPLLGLEQPPCEGVTAVPRASWPGPATSPSNTPVPTTAGAWGWRRCSPKDSAHLLSPGSMLPAPGSLPGFGLTPSLLIPDDRKTCPAHIQCQPCMWEQISHLLVFSTACSPACCCPRVSFLSPGVPRSGFTRNVLLGKAMQLLCEPEIAVYRAVRQS